MAEGRGQRAEGEGEGFALTAEEHVPWGVGDDVARRMEQHQVEDHHL